MAETAPEEMQEAQQDEGALLPRVSVIIPVPPEMDAPAVLEALEEIDYPREKIEVILAKGRRPSTQRNRAVAEAGGEILFFLDDDSMVDSGLFRANTAFYREQSVAGVGGPALPTAAENVVQAATDVVFSSIFGDFRGCMKYAKRGAARMVSEDRLILCNMSIRREAFEETGGFHEDLYPNEENALLQKILRSPRGWKFMYAPEAVIRRPRPRTVWEFFAKVAGYGTGRLEQTLIQPSPICLLRLTAVLFPLYWVLLPFAAGVTRWAFLPAAAYAAGNLVMSAKIYMTVRSVRIAAAAFGLFPVMHLAYPLGIIWAGTGRRILGKRRGDGGVEIVKVKEFGGD